MLTRRVAEVKRIGRSFLGLTWFGGGKMGGGKAGRRGGKEEGRGKKEGVTFHIPDYQHS